MKHYESLGSNMGTTGFLRYIDICFGIRMNHGKFWFIIKINTNTHQASMNIEHNLDPKPLGPILDIPRGRS